LYKDKIKYLHDKYAHSKEFKVGNLVLLFNSRLRLLFGELDLKNKNGEILRVNGHGVKHYLGKIDDNHVVEMIYLK